MDGQSKAIQKCASKYLILMVQHPLPAHAGKLISLIMSVSISKNMIEGKYLVELFSFIRS